ncbi:bifunctional 5,10-methylenetetrahydrofolate dehydrogenase/5,10-methenyltetrahydrofolate cyclohydrolase [Candidatus Daviesbacteria bacterium]|nr:bifunctional 5,10-methylenetetrahydrofolate dehydrogenase/5,10-methenyltetrahydrofolate cyclohydrolase [Candidatus Daviesbacteria bacterium]
MKVSGKRVADIIAQKLQQEALKLKVKPALAIILAGDNPASRIYVNNKVKRAQEVGIEAKLLEFSQNQFQDCLTSIEKLNEDKNIHGIIIQYPTYEGWDFEKLLSKIDPKKDVDGFLKDSPFFGATAIGVWEMLTAFAYQEGFKTTEDFLKGKKIVLLGRGKTAGAPTKELLESKGFTVEVVTRETENPDEIIRGGDVVISATGVKHIINKSNLKKGSYVIGVGVGKEIIDGQSKIYGDINEEEVAEVAKLYCPTIGGIGPLTIVSLLNNVVKSAQGDLN